MIISLDCPLVISGRCILAKDSYIESHGSTLCNLDKRDRLLKACIGTCIITMHDSAKEM